ncbi:5-formyltetrahydrofolate cyclo-ligase [Fibrella sp. HMF5335]|uniref:5-formyltetrahydrofolate cyclo-ligase n=1 Tax=Fibrella rubiginis TaxID=2817060 RepID=A0A939K454_9BACT|nr:5-formyltetrahydrofolate cyclo-ligase [Fibrella rubiginis]MBO0938079.1 5-formyltetrahydrofolate cyclo-ligase [Fibrella rubiginis]
MTKAQLRAEYKQKRALLTFEAVSAMSQQLADRFFADEEIQHVLVRPAAVLHTFLPIVRQHEVDTWPIIRRIWAEFTHVRVVASITDTATRTLPAFDLFPDTVLVDNRWGIPEPPSIDQPVPPGKFDLVLVPLLAFDQQGHRVGYGGGYYDRLLAQCRPDCLKIGLSLFDPVPQIEAIELTDIALRACICPEHTYWM